MDERLKAFERLLNVMDDLREKCPWDKKQTNETLRKLTIEETYELSDAIIKKDAKAIKEELGDLFLHLVFYSKIGTEQQQFTVADVLNSVCEKLIYRHPHIYGDVQVKDEEEVKRNWEQLKLKEGKKSVLEGVPNSLPALNKAQRIQDKVKAVGFDWDDKSQVMQKVMEELQELQEAVASDKQQDIELEFGDVLFALINYSRFIGVDTESALEKTNQKFIDRFKKMEILALEGGSNIATLSLGDQEKLWQKVKKQ